MSVPERFQAMEQLWSAICRDAPDMPSPGWHQEILEEREARVKRGEARFLTLAQLRSRLEKRTS